MESLPHDLEPDTEPGTVPDGLYRAIAQTRRISTTTLAAADRVLGELRRRTIPPPSDEEAKAEEP